MDPTQPSQDLITWLLGDWRRAALWTALVLVPALVHRYLSYRVGQCPRPEMETPWTRLLGRISGAVWADTPGSVKPIGGAMPAGRLTPEGGFRSGTTDPKISGSYARVTGPQPTIPPPPPGSGAGLTILIGFLFAFGSGCGVSTYAKRQKAAEGYQEESFERQKQETDRLTKLGYFSCNAWSDRSMRGAQGVIDANRDIAKGTPGAAEKRAFWEAWADKLHKTMVRHCELAADTATLLKGAPFDKLPALPQPAGAAEDPAAPSAPAPPASAPVSLPSPLQPPQPPAAPPMPAAPAMPSPALPQPPAVP